MSQDKTEVSFVKWLIGITGAILMIYVILSAAWASSRGESMSAAAKADRDGGTVVYCAREHEDKIAIYEDDRLVYETDTRVSDLPRSDRKKLEEGIDLFSDEELKQFIEDYCS